MKRHAPAAQRNRQPILDAIRHLLPARGLVLDIASGSGEHALHFAKALPALTWQPSDRDPEALLSIEAWRAEEGPRNLLPALRLDVLEEPWPLQRCDAVVCINMLHISPYTCAEALFRNAAPLLPSGGPLFTYGPYKLHGEHTAPSNFEFDGSLQSRNPQWGVRDMDELRVTAEAAGLDLVDKVIMPANNFTLVFRRR